MPSLIPSLNSCIARMTSGEKRFAVRLEQKLDDDYLIWYDVPIGKKQLHPDFIVLHPLRGLLVLEVNKAKSFISLQEGVGQDAKAKMEGCDLNTIQLSASNREPIPI